MLAGERAQGRGERGIARDHGSFHFHVICCLRHQYGIIQQTLVEQLLSTWDFTISSHSCPLYKQGLLRTISNI